MHVSKLFSLENQTAIITGGSRGIGLQMAQALGEMGCTIVLVARKAQALHQAKRLLTEQGIRTHHFVADLGDPEQITELVEHIYQAVEDIDILVNNAGTTWGAPAVEYPDEAWHKVINLNLNATYYLSKAIGKRSMIPRQSGKIINIASIAGLLGNPKDMHTIAYNSSKGGVISFTRALAAEWGVHNINVNAICPGFFPSKMSQGLLAQLGEHIIAQTPLGRLGGDHDLKGTVVFLASAAARHITGQTIAIDGGASII